METIQAQRRLVLAGAAILLALALAFPWVEAWPVENIGELVLAEPVTRFADIYPHFRPLGWWTHDEYESVSLRLDVVLLELVAIAATAAWALACLDLRGAGEKKPLYCDRALQPSPVSSASSGTVGPLG